MPLTIKEVQHAKAGRHSDGNGLYLLVKPTGAASWVLRVQHQGQRKDFGLGSLALQPLAAEVPIERRKMLTLADAREKARFGRALAKAGISPSQHWRQAATLMQAPPTFKEVAEARHKALKSGWRNGKHREEWLGSLERYAFATIGGKPVDAVDTDAIEKVLMPIWLAKPETARRVKQRIGVILDYAHGKGWRSTEAPMRSVDAAMRAIRQPKRGNFAAMPYKDLPDFMRALRACEQSVGRLALQFLILNAARSGEIRFARWREMDLDAAQWRIPAERMKSGETHIVPLGVRCNAILKQLRAMFGCGADDLVFPGLKGTMSDGTMAKAFRNAGGGDYTVHGLRSTFRDWAADNGFANDWAEAALAHSVAGQQGKTAAAYKRTTYFEHRRDRLMPAWAAYVTGADDTEKIVAIGSRKKPA